MGCRHVHTLAMQSKFRRLVARSPIARGAAFPFRAAAVARYDTQLIKRSLVWLVHGRETMNFTYDLDPLNRDQLGWFVSSVTGTQVEQVRTWMRELENDHDLIEHVTSRLSTNPLWRISEREPHWARRLGWYALIRAIQPEHVVETGTDLGLGSCVIAAALLRNAHGHLTTIDIDPEAGYLIGQPWSSVIEFRTGNSIDVLASVPAVDVFLHDSLHTYEYETLELTTIERNLRPNAIIISDNAQESLALSEWAERTDRQYLFFKELPLKHWWPGEGIGVAWAKGARDNTLASRQLRL